MNLTKNISHLVVITILPLIPVILLYWLFADLNYFEWTNDSRGIFAFGPIASYPVFLLIVWRIYIRMFPERKFYSQNLKKLKGEWKIESRSNHNTEYIGNIQISTSGYVIDLSGSLYHNGEYNGQIETILSRLVKNKLHLIYRLTDNRNQGAESIGYSLLDVNFNRNTMGGYWAVVNSQIYGSVKYSKK